MQGRKPLKPQRAPPSPGGRKGIQDRGRREKTIAAVIAEQTPVAEAGHERNFAAKGRSLLSQRGEKARLSLEASEGVSGSVVDVHAQLALRGRRGEPL